MSLNTYNALAHCQFVTYNALVRCYLQRAVILTNNAQARCYQHAVTLLQMTLSGHHTDHEQTPYKSADLLKRSRLSYSSKIPLAMYTHTCTCDYPRSENECIFFQNIIGKTHFTTPLQYFGSFIVQVFHFKWTSIFTEIANNNK